MAALRLEQPLYRSRLSHWLAALAGGVLVAGLGIKKFEPWEQVVDLWDSGASLFLLAVSGHPHFFRYLTAYPGFLLEEMYPEIGFSLFISFFLAANVLLWRRVAFNVLGRAPTAMAWVMFLSVHFFMNGRGVIAWTGWLLCVSICLRIEKGNSGGLKSLPQLAVASWLAAVSTGVFIVVVMSLAFFYMRFGRQVRSGPFRKAMIALIAAPLLFYVGQYLVLAVKKNVDFFGGGLAGVYHMLAHGLGRVLFGNELLAVVLVAAAAFMLLFLFMFVKMRNRNFTPLETLIGFACFGGLFGLTVLTLAVPLALVYYQDSHQQEPDTAAP